ncbi:hypothetical protein GCM10023231_31430 [Olivibacter ginsenosidimutans]|uniref:DUF7402 domain-containing protein n=1 Tax=Olivibacter ginsenosidimutans TaxID=1176537 RepID=A0ABP9BYF2_9SPHI
MTTIMKNNRRNFLKTIGLSSGALLLNPVSGFSEDSASHYSESTLDEQVFARKKITTDFLVAGGGMAGVCAALAAARNGSKVVLIQNRSRLGGNASSEIRMHISGASALKQVWRETGILEELMLTEAVINQQKSYEMLDYVLYDKIVSNPNITLLFDTMLHGVSTDGHRITAIEAYCSQTEEVYEVSATYFADCTGDGTLAALAGAEFMRGRESKDAFGETLGLAKPDDITMGNSLLFMADEHDKPMPFEAPSWARKYTYKDFQYRKIHSFEYGYWWIELGGLEDIVHDGQKIRHDLMAVIFGIWDYIKNSGNHPQSANWALSWFGAIPGKRESRRITGDYIITQRDVQAPKLFEDRVAYGGWPLDDHLPAGMDDTSLDPFRSIPLKGPYSIPLRSLYSKSFDNLVMAGRNISTTHVALSSTRVMATCATMGQAIGTAVAFCNKNGLTPAKLAKDPAKLQEYQQLLLRQDQAMLGVKNTDPLDLALKARIKASAETDDGKASQVIDGINRDVQDGNTHQWRGTMGSDGAWIELAWKTPQDIRTIEFTFDTGLHRFLRISGQKSVLKGQVRGPQTETVSDYLIEGFSKKNRVFEQKIAGNYQRKVVHQLTPFKADRLRITVLKTHGDPLAKIFEIRCYA